MKKFLLQTFLSYWFGDNSNRENCKKINMEKIPWSQLTKTVEPADNLRQHEWFAYLKQTRINQLAEDLEKYKANMSKVKHSNGGKITTIVSGLGAVSQDVL